MESPSPTLRSFHCFLLVGHRSGLRLRLHEKCWTFREKKSKRAAAIRSTILNGWRPNLARRWRIYVDGSVLGHIRDTLHDVLDIPLMTAFIERWQPEANSFHLPCYEMTVMLHDVYQILKLQIRGQSMAYNPSFVSLGSYQSRQDEFVNNDCTEFSLRPHKGGSRNMTWSEFKKWIMTKDNGFATNNKVTAYLVFLMYAALIPDKTGDRVHLRYVYYLDLFERFEETTLMERIAYVVTSDY